ncbi:hypothetical protein ACJQWK_06794 [Exserohilum turcicum]
MSDSKNEDLPKDHKDLLNSHSHDVNAPAFNPRSTPIQNPVQENATENNHNNTGTPHLPPPAGADPDLWKVLCSGPQTIDITTERNQSPPSHPHFLRDITCSPTTWHTTVLPWILTLTFRLNSTTDIFHFTSMLRVPSLSSLQTCITALDLRGFHWFTGIGGNRVANPYVELATHLPALRALRFSLHAAGVTVSRWSEKRAVELEATDAVLARRRRIMRCSEVWEKYGIGGLLRCEVLEWIGIVYVESEIVNAFSAPWDPEGVVTAVGEALVDGFRRGGREVSVEVLRE